MVTESLQITPEFLEIANSYLSLQSVEKVATEFNMQPNTVLQVLDKPEVKSYISQVYFDIGYNNRFKMRKALDLLIQKKLEELSEADTGSNKDIADLLQLSHKITMEYMEKELELEKVKQGELKNQVNVQINNNNNYGQLLEKLLEKDIE